MVWPLTCAFSVLSMGLANGGNCQAYSTSSTPASATAPKITEDTTRLRVERGLLVTGDVKGAGAGAGELRGASVSGVLDSVMKSERRNEVR
ncbi:hypothetical protein ALQ36_103762 [Pseudomonas syringae pv. primulae]|uniref:Uncharacterized protein n=1 Tax=Pseudomonas syringae pv. primulae TaxID=251707 RepID=A0A3M5TY43_9PSED|nr:hypothetical protein ALQ36_103762 [Pseudomonas syringae pv. primulae]RMU38545.1 hypothetical protein ALP30_104325 [Pseudomonas syringae pv. primulae]